MVSVTRKFRDEAASLGLTVYTRKGWGSSLGAVYAWRLLWRRHKLLPGKPCDTLWQHITVTKDTGCTSKSFKEDVKTLEKIGYSRFGSGISYNLAWDMKTGEFALGQPFSAKGTHTVNNKHIPNYSFDQNAVSIAICAIGMPGDKPTEEAANALSKCITALILAGILTHGFDYNPHSMVAYKDCPTQAIRDIMPSVGQRARRRAKRILDARAGITSAKPAVIQAPAPAPAPISQCQPTITTDSSQEKPV